MRELIISHLYSQRLQSLSKTKSGDNPTSTLPTSGRDRTGIHCHCFKIVDWIHHFEDDPVVVPIFNLLSFTKQIESCCIMNPRPILVFVVLLFSLTLPAQDWMKIATETEEPAFAMEIFSVRPDSQAEALGLKPGDFVYQIGESAMRGFVKRSRKEDNILFYCPKGGKKETVQVAPGLLGVDWFEMARPQLDYLRGDIGTSDPRWDKLVAAALANLERDPLAAADAWKNIKILGYPDDELDAFVRAQCCWLLGQPIPVREAFEKIDAEFSPMPRGYAAHLEDMAFASGQIDLLGRLYESDPPSSTLTTDQLETWKKLGNSPLPNRRLIEQARKIQARNITGALVALEDESRPGDSARLDQLRNLGSFNVSAGKYSMTKFRLPDGVQNFYLSAKFHLYVWAFDERWASCIRLGAFSGVPLDKKTKNRTLVELGVCAHRFWETEILFSGGHNDTDRRVTRFGKPIPSKVKALEGESPAMSSAFHLEIIRLGNEIAAYCDGVAYCHLPINPDDPTTELQWFVSGIAAKAANFEVWSLNPE